MKTSDYIVEYLIKTGITDVFGYPGGMVTHLMDSLYKRSSEINTHILLHEDAASFAACGFAQASGKVGVAFATSGPGATNLLTGIANAYFDSISTVFITGNVNTFESKMNSGLRQKGFQETNIVSMAKPICKKTFYIEKKEDVCKIVNEAFQIAVSNRKGPVLIDIPMDIMRANIDSEGKNICIIDNKQYDNEIFEQDITNALLNSKRPCILVGNGIKISKQVGIIRGILRSCHIPVVSSMIACDIIPEDQGLEGIYYGYIGAYGNRTANFVVAKSDLVICIGTRLSIRQVGANRSNFAPNAKIFRIDVDENELKNVIREDDNVYKISIEEALPIIRKVLNSIKSYDEWINVCKEIKNQIKYFDETDPNRIINAISKKIPDGYGVVADVGQHMVWVAQSFHFKPNQVAYFSGGMGVMGYALPAAIGVYYASKKPVICFIGDGGMQMIIEELQFIKTNKLPIKIFVINNNALGMIRHFQEMYFDKQYAYTVSENGYTSPDFCKIASAYGINSIKLTNLIEVNKIDLNGSNSLLYDVVLKGDTYVFPKLEYGKPNQDQEPLLDRELYNYLMSL